MKTWLLLDGNNLLHRAFHALKGVLAEDPSAALFGFFKDCLSLRDKFMTEQLVFTFDCGRSFRKGILPGYKANRDRPSNLDDTVMGNPKKVLKDTLRRLPDILTDAGFNNVCRLDGYEADDVLASVAKSLTRKTVTDEMVIVSTDKDLLQCLNHDRVKCYDPVKKVLTDETDFRNRWGLLPAEWATVKAIAGCRSDNVKGVRGVGEANAVKFLTGELREGTRFHRLVTKGWDTVEETLRVTRLPLEGCPEFGIDYDPTPRSAWENVCQRFNFPTLLLGKTLKRA